MDKEFILEELVNKPKYFQSLKQLLEQDTDEYSIKWESIGKSIIGSGTRLFMDIVVSKTDSHAQLYFTDRVSNRSFDMKIGDKNQSFSNLSTTAMAALKHITETVSQRIEQQMAFKNEI